MSTESVDARSRAAHARLFRTYRMRALVFLAVALVCGGLAWVAALPPWARLPLWLAAASSLIGVVADVNAAFNHWKAANGR